MLTGGPLTDERIQRVATAVAQEVVKALSQMTPQDPAAKDAKVVGWTDALDYGPVKALQETLKVGAYASK